MKSGWRAAGRAPRYGRRITVPTKSRNFSRVGNGVGAWVRDVSIPVKPVSSRRRAVSSAVANRKGQDRGYEAKGGVAATWSARLYARFRLPAPPHCATSSPPGLSAANRERNNVWWSVIQWKTALEKTTSSDPARG